MSLDSLLRPRSITIRGAAEDFVKINGRLLKFLLDKGYPGRVLPVNPKYDRIAGLPCSGQTLRYNITSEEDLRQGSLRLAEYVKAQPATSAGVRVKAAQAKGRKK